MIQRATQVGLAHRVLDGWLEEELTDNIKVAGDPLMKRLEGCGILRVGFQNIRGTDLNKGFAITPEFEAMYEVGTDIQGMA